MTKYWVGGTGNWDASDTTHWANSSGGAGGQSVPGPGDNVVFDAASGGGKVTITAPQTVYSISGGAHTGEVDFNGQDITLYWMNWSGSGIRTLTLGSSHITIIGGENTVFDLTTTTNLTFNPGTSNIECSGGSWVNFKGGGKTFSTVTFSGGGSYYIYGANTFTNIVCPGTSESSNSLTALANQTVIGTLTLNGNSETNRLTFSGDSQRTITAASLSTQYTDFQNIKAAGAADWNLNHQVNQSFNDLGGNSGIIFIGESPVANNNMMMMGI